MKRAHHFVTGGAIAVLFLVLFYMFSFPLAVWFALWYLPHMSTEGIVAFYDPGLELGLKFPLYQTILELEGRLLGVGITYHP